MNMNRTFAALALAVGGGIVMGSGAHSPQWWNGPTGLILMSIGFFQCRSRKGAALVGLLGGVSYFGIAMPFLLAGYHSIGITGAKPVAGVLALYVLLAGWWAPAFALAHSVSPSYRAAALAPLWIGAELLRSWVFPAIPAAQIASIWSQTPVILLSHHITVEGLGALTVGLAVSAARSLTAQKLPAREVLILVLAGVLSGRLADAPASTPPLPRLALIDTHIPQGSRWDDTILPGYMDDLMTRTRTAFDRDRAQLVVWPESSVPFFPEEIAALESARPGPGQYLALGMMVPVPTEAGRFTNSIVVLDHELRQVARYDKRHLFPFGEYMPFAEWIERMTGLTTIAAETNAIVPGKSTLMPIQLPGLGRIVPAICYEGAFPLPHHLQAADYILLVSNDAWWLGTHGGRFTEQEARMRAIEAGLPLVRVPNMHPPLVTDALGRPQQLPLNDRRS